MINVLTGFKFIGEKIKEFEADGNHTYVFGFEESYGYLTGTYARDKDAVAASLLVAEMAAHYREKGMTLADALNALYEEYGYYGEKTVSITMKGVDGAEKMKALMSRLRNIRPQSLAGIDVVQVFDLQNGAMGLPASDVMYYRLADGSVLVVRPSGTEPKVKFYVLVKGTSSTDVTAKIDSLRTEFFSFAEINN